MVDEGARVRLRPQSRLAREHPEILNAIGVVGSVLHGPSWATLGAPPSRRARDVTMHIRFREVNVIALNVPVHDVEAIDTLSPERRAG